MFKANKANDTNKAVITTKLVKLFFDCFLQKDEDDYAR